MKKVLFALGFIWVLPISLLFWIFGLFLLITRQVEKFKVNSDLTFLWDLKNNGWFCKLVFSNRGWGGFSCGNNVLIVDSDPDRWGRSLLHEQKHCHQQYAFGVFYYPVYILESVWIWLAVKADHSYYDNWFEVAARKYAGQPIHIPKEQWADGENDRWAFW